MTKQWFPYFYLITFSATTGIDILEDSYSSNHIVRLLYPLPFWRDTLGTLISVGKDAIALSNDDFNASAICAKECLCSISRKFWNFSTSETSSISINKCTWSIRVRDFIAITYSSEEYSCSCNWSIIRLSRITWSFSNRNRFCCKVCFIAFSPLDCTCTEINKCK